MPLSIPPELKKITPFVKRAEELDRDKANPESRLVAYYCRQYAVHVGIPIASSSPAGKTCLGTLLGELEKEKEAMSNFTREESKYLCRAFADKIFDKADAEDRAGAATKATAKTFYAAATFFEILQQFQEEGEEPTADQEEERNKTVYSKWKATEILKAIKEGRQPTPGGYGEKDDEKEEEETGEEQEQEEVGPPEEEPEQSEEPQMNEEPEEKDDDEGTEIELLGPPPEYPGESDSPPEVFVDDRPPIAPPMAPSEPPSFPVAPTAPAAPPPAAKSSNKWFGSKKKSSSAPPTRVSNEAMEDAKELTKFALSALDSKDVELACSRLQQALEALGR